MDSGAATDNFSNVGYFSNWNSYRLNLLFSTYVIETPLQFALTWFAVVFAVIFFHFLDAVVTCMDKGMIGFLSKDEKYHPSELNSNGYNQKIARPVGWTLVKIIRGLFAALKYGLSLMLMLIAMTFNPSLFLALFIGYWVGDIIFCDFHINMSMNTIKAMYSDGGFVGSVIRGALLVPLSRVEHVRQYMYDKNLIEDEEKQGYTSLSRFTEGCLMVMPRVISLTFFVVLIYWIVTTQNGFGYDESNIFGWHALLMSFFAAMFTNEALLTFKAPLLPQMANSRSILR